MARQTRIRALLVRLSERDQYRLPHRSASVELHMLTAWRDHTDLSGPRSYVGYDEARKVREMEPKLQEIRVTAALATDLGDRSYGWTTCYRHPYEVDLDRAVGMAEVLKLVAKRLEEADRLIGRPASFGQYAARVANALNCQAIVFERDDVQVAPYANYDQREEAGRYQWLTTGAGAHKIDSLIAEWHERHPSTRVIYEEEAQRQLAAG